MRILYIQPSNVVGGAELSLLEMVRRLPDAGGEAQVVLAGPAKGQSPTAYQALLRPHVQKIHQFHLPSWVRRERLSVSQRAIVLAKRLRQGWYLASAWRLARLIRRERIDLVHTNTGLTPVGALASLAAGVPHVWHVRERLGANGLFPLTPGDRLARFAIEQCSAAVVCNSKYTAAFFGAASDKTVVIQNGLCMEDYAGAAARGRAMRVRLGIAADAVVVGMVGSVRSKVKEHELFLEAAAQARARRPDLLFVVFGGDGVGGGGEHYDRLRRLGDTLDLADSLRWIGYEADIPAMMHVLDVMAHPTSKEGSGRVVMEAMASGRAVVGVRAGGVEELIDPGTTGLLVPPKDAAAMAQAVLRLADDEGERRAVGDAAREYAVRHFSAGRMCEAIFDVYATALQRRSRTPRVT